MSRIDATQRERCACGAEYEVGGSYIGPERPPHQIAKWRAQHGRGCDLMYACLTAAEQGDARRRES